MEKNLSPLVGETEASQKLEKPAVEKEPPLHGPVPNTIYTEAYVTTLAKYFYLWGWPMTNIHNRYLLFNQLEEPMYGGGVLPLALPSRMCMLTDYGLKFSR